MIFNTDNALNSFVKWKSCIFIVCSSETGPSGDDRFETQSLKILVKVHILNLSFKISLKLIILIMYGQNEDSVSRSYIMNKAVMISRRNSK